MSLLDRINKEIETTEATIDVFEAPSDATMSAYQESDLVSESTGR